MKQVFFLTLLLFVNILGKDKMANLEYNKQKIYIIGSSRKNIEGIK